MSLLTTGQTLDKFKHSLNHIHYDKLMQQLRPDYYIFFKSLARVPDGVQTIMKLRQDLLDVIENS